MLLKVRWFPVLMLASACLFGQENTTASMGSVYRTQAVEEGKRNLIFQNRCGNRLTLMFFDDRTELEFVYKPNAFRRRDFRARNFSNRDNYTLLFQSCSFPDVKAGEIEDFGWDPFHTVIRQKTAWMARNTITVVNVADENAFVLAARSPLTLCIRPHRAFFEVEDGLLAESFTDRGEDIVSFVRFPGFEANRYRVLRDGTAVLQLLENDVVLIGGEDSRFQVGRVTAALAGLDLQTLSRRNESILEPLIDAPDIRAADPGIRRVLEINRRAMASMFDAGGVTFGALCRIYHLIWTRDGSMASSLMARAGNPDYVKLWTPFLLANPSVTRLDDGSEVREFLQMVGTRWTKWEDDGPYYALLSLFTLVQTTGDDAVVRGELFSNLLDAVNRNLEKGWECDQGMMGSDTRGETTLADNPYFGYDAVNGRMDPHNVGGVIGGKTLKRSYSLYHQVNTYNVLMMAASLLDRNPGLDRGRSACYLEIAAALKRTIRERFLDPRGFLYAGREKFTDGTEKWQTFSAGADYWEYAWAVSLGPFFPAQDLALESGRMVKPAWPAIRNIGYCPWNTLARLLTEYGMPGSGFDAMLRDEFREALTISQKYPMAGAVTEYQGDVEGWRALPFQIGGLFQAFSSRALQGLPQGIAVRASGGLDSLLNFRYRLSRIDYFAKGNGDAVSSCMLNGRPLDRSLQIPHGLLRAGTNRVDVLRGPSHDGFRLYGSDAELLECSAGSNRARYLFHSAVPAQLVFENADKASVLTVRDREGREIPFTRLGLKATNKTVVLLEPAGDFEVSADW